MYEEFHVTDRWTGEVDRLGGAKEQEVMEV